MLSFGCHTAFGLVVPTTGPPAVIQTTATVTVQSRAACAPSTNNIFPTDLIADGLFGVELPKLDGVKLPSMPSMDGVQMPSVGSLPSVGGLSLPSKLPHGRAKALLAALLDSLTSARGAEVGYRVGALLLQTPAPPLDAAAQADITAVVALVECEMSKRLGEGDASASSAASSSSTPPPPSVAPLAPPGPSAPPAQPAAPDEPPADAPPPPPFVLDAAVSIGANLERLVALRLRRALQADEQTALASALEVGLSVLHAGTAEARRQLLAASAIVALSNVGATQLWACALDACGDGEVEGVAALAATITANCGTISSALLGAALDL